MRYKKIVKTHFARYEDVSKSFQTGRLGRELQTVQLSATRCSCIAILWVTLVSFAAIALSVASQRVFIVVSVYFVMTQSGNFWIHSHMCLPLEYTYLLLFLQKLSCCTYVFMQTSYMQDTLHANHLQMFLFSCCCSQFSCWHEDVYRSLTEKHFCSVRPFLKGMLFALWL
jgi:hypothetical protein